MRRFSPIWSTVHAQLSSKARLFLRSAAMRNVRASFKPCHLSCLVAALVVVAAASSSVWAETGDTTKAVSFYRDVRPILQAYCVGCHQPAKKSGELDLTSVSAAKGVTESGELAIVPGKSDESHLIELITPHDGEAEMPKESSPLRDSDIRVIRHWIDQGALDDTPQEARRFDTANPPTYHRPPVITSLDWSPDGKLLAVAGHHEVLLHKADGSGLVARLIGNSERI